MLKKITFKKALIGSIIASMLLICVGLCFAWQYLADYETSLPETLANDILTAYTDKNLALYENYFIDSPVLDKVEDAMINDDIFLYCAKQNTNEIIYHIVNNGYKMSEITLSQMSTESTMGFLQYEIKSIENFPLKIHITMPGNAEISINHHKIDQSMIHDIHTTSIIEGDPYHVSTFYVIDYVPTQEITAILDGETCEVIKAENGYVVKAPISDKDRELVTSIATAYTKSYMEFATKRYVPSYTVLQYVKPLTNLSGYISSYNNEWGIISNSDQFTKLEVTNLEKIGEHRIQCDVSAIYELELKDDQIQESPFKYQLTIELNDEGGLVEKMERPE